MEKSTSPINQNAFPSAIGTDNWSNDSGLKLKSVAFEPKERGIFVRFYDNFVGYCSVQSLISKDDLRSVIPESVFIGQSGLTVVFPMKEGGEYDVDYLALRSVFDSQIRTKLAELEVRSAFQLGERIKTARKKRGWTQIELGRKSGLDQAVISRMERGVHYPRMETLERTAETFSIPVSELLLGV